MDFHEDPFNHYSGATHLNVEGFHVIRVLLVNSCSVITHYFLHIIPEGEPPPFCSPCRPLQLRMVVIKDFLAFVCYRVVDGLRAGCTTIRMPLQAEDSLNIINCLGD